MDILEAITLKTCQMTASTLTTQAVKTSPARPSSCKANADHIISTRKSFSKERRVQTANRHYRVNNQSNNSFSAWDGEVSEQELVDR
jgi:hypothetical protein